MIRYAAVDIRGGKAVQLVGGNADDVRIELDDPVAVALGWIDAGFSALHVVDLDAAMAVGENRSTISAILAASSVPVQVGGGVRSDAAVDYWMEAGAAAVVIGTRAVQDCAWLRGQTARHAGRIVVAADVRSGMVATHGWQQTAAVEIDTFIAQLEDVAVGGILVTDIVREGRMRGVDIPLFSRLAAATSHPLIASGGIAAPADLVALADAGVAAAILGMALYTGAFDTCNLPRSQS